MAQKKQKPQRNQRDQTAKGGRSDRARSTKRTPRERDTGPNPTPPEASNAAHPGRPGARQSKPGVGIVSAGADRDAGRAGGAGRGRRAQGSPGAARKSTTTSRPAAVPSGSGDSASLGGAPAESSITAGGAALSNPRNAGAGPRGAEAGAGNPEIHDPNYTAATAKRRPPRDTGTTRMDRRDGANPQARQRMKETVEPRTVSDLMTADVEVCTPDTTLYYVGRMMLERDVGAIPVVESTESMKPVGVVTDRDIVVRLVARNQNPLDFRAQDCMSTDVVTVRDDATINECGDLMERKQVRRMIVVSDEGRVCGIVAQADLARHAPADETLEVVREVSQPDRPGAAGTYH